MGSTSRRLVSEPLLSVDCLRPSATRMRRHDRTRLVARRPLLRYCAALRLWIGRAAFGRFSAPARAGFIRDLDQGRAPAALNHCAPEDGHYKGTPAERPQFDFSYDGVMRSVEESLARLGLDHVDVLLVHDPDDHYKEAADGTFRALQRLRADGTVKAIGAGMNQSEMCSGPPAESNRPARLRRSGRAAIPAFGEASEETRDRDGHRGFSRIRCRLQTTTSWSGNRR